MDESMYSPSTSDLLKTLSLEEKEQLEKQTFVSDFKKDKLQKEARKNWDKFYNRNRDNFFKDRHWTQKEFTDICSSLNFKDNIVFIEAGCGVGNLIFPLMEFYPYWKFCGFDFSNHAIQLLNDRAEKLDVKIFSHVLDITDEDAVAGLQLPSADLISLVFVLSAISPNKHETVLKNIHRLLKPGGFVVFRDYAIYDHAMLRFKRDCKIEDRFYVRQDGTCAYYFYTEEIEKLFTDSGFRAVKTEYIHKRTVNTKENIDVPRIFVQGCFQRNI
uniref:tRNA N(3)-methylcytidine methyltransferase n=1 Tax=Acrobeloides nanus TaxID=290746 RepID=A0A914CC79_9BILA